MLDAYNNWASRFGIRPFGMHLLNQLLFQLVIEY